MQGEYCARHYEKAEAEVKVKVEVKVEVVVNVSIVCWILTSISTLIEIYSYLSCCPLYSAGSPSFIQGGIGAPLR